MGNRHFSQYLLNKGILTADNAGAILAECHHTAPGLSVLALERNFIDAEQSLELSGAGDTAVAALSRNYLTALQLDDLKKEAPNRRACLGQVVLNRKLVDFSGLAKLFKDNDGEYCYPVNEVFEELLQEQGVDADDYEYIRDYVELFLSTLQKFMRTNALIVRANNSDVDDTTYLTYQSMGGALSLTVGCRMTRSVMLAMGSRFGGEHLERVDEMAIDCIEEFCNVLNGLYIVNMSGKSRDMDLDMPRTIENVEPVGDDVFQLRVETELGSFMLYMSMNGFIFNDGKSFKW